MSKIILLFIALLLTAFTASAKAAIPPFAIVEDGTLILYDDKGNTTEVVDAAGIYDFAWNTDGTKLAFFMYDERFTSELGVFDVASGEVTMLPTRKLSNGYPISWTSEGEILYVSYFDEAEQLVLGERGLQATVYSIAPTADGEETALGSFESFGECGGGSALPVDWLYSAETGSLGGFFLTLEETPYGIVHSMACSGDLLGLLNVETGESEVIAENFTRAVVSSDGTQIAGIALNRENPSDTQMMVVDLETGEMNEVTTEGTPDQLTWSYEGDSIYYTVRTPSENPVYLLSDEQQDKLDRTLGYNVEELPAYSTSIYRVGVESGESTEVFSGEVVNMNSYGIVRLTDTPNGLFFTSIPNLNQWLDAVTSGRLDYNPAPSTEVEFVQPSVMLLGAGETEAAFLGMYGQFTPLITR